MEYHAKIGPVFACYCWLLQVTAVTAGYSENVEYHAKMAVFACYSNILQKQGPFLHIIAGHSKIWNIMQKTETGSAFAC